MAKPGQKRDRSIFAGGTDAGPLFTRALGQQEEVQLPEGFDPNSPEVSYRQTVSADHRTRLGQFFTPQPIAELMCSWVLSAKPSRILDPATGTGIFVRELVRTSPNAKITALDVDPLVIEAAKAAIDAPRQVNFIQADFLTWNTNSVFDAAIANPPYLKHHNFAYPFDIFADIGEKNRVRLSRLTNIYGLFILEICRRLTQHGRAAIIVPGEWVNANFGKSIKHYLLRDGMLKVLIYFSHLSVQFDDALTTASILLIEKGSGNRSRASVLTAYVEDEVPVSDLLPLCEEEIPSRDGVITQRLETELMLSEQKWDYLLQATPQEEPPGFVPLSLLAETRRGIATGANDFFLISKQKALEHRLSEKFLVKCIGHAVDVPSYVFRHSDYVRVAESGGRALLVVLAGVLPKAERTYVEVGEDLGLANRYLLAKRSPWYSMEKRAPAPIWSAVFGRKGLRFIFNEPLAHNLTTFHCIYPKSSSKVLHKALVACLNSPRVQQLSRRHRRVYGNGLAKFEPRDLLSLLLPNLLAVGQALLSDLADLLDDLDAANRQSATKAEKVLRRIDDLVDEAATRAAIAGEEAQTKARPD